MDDSLIYKAAFCVLHPMGGKVKDVAKGWDVKLET